MKTVKRLASTFALSVILLMSAEASACPNCKLANESTSNRPKAYMYSILFMIGMPATIFTGFGLNFYRMVRKAQAAETAAQLDSPASNLDS